MKANNLRIGNLVDIGKEVNELELVDFVDMYENDTLKHFDPIPLTEEWLLKFGFENDGTKEDNEFYSKKILGENKSTYQFVFRINDGISDCLITEKICSSDSEHVIVPKLIKHVHQLQNLYFALTGDELTLNSN